MNKKGIQQINCLTTIFTVLILCVLCARASAQTSSVTIQMKDARLEEVISAIENQTPYLFLYIKGVNLQQPVTVNVVKRPLKEALDQIAASGKLEYAVQDLQIILSVRSDNTKQEQSLRGIITDGTLPITGATVAAMLEIKTGRSP